MLPTWGHQQRVADNKYYTNKRCQKLNCPNSIGCAIPAAHRFAATTSSQAITSVSPMRQATRITLFPLLWSAL